MATGCPKRLEVGANLVTVEGACVAGLEPFDATTTLFVPGSLDLVPVDLVVFETGQKA